MVTKEKRREKKKKRRFRVQTGNNESSHGRGIRQNKQRSKSLDLKWKKKLVRKSG